MIAIKSLTASRAAERAAGINPSSVMYVRVASVCVRAGTKKITGHVSCVVSPSWKGGIC